MKKQGLSPLGWGILRTRGTGLRSIPRAAPVAALSVLVLLALGTAPAAANEAPVIDSLTASPAFIAPGGSVTFTVQAHDPDCIDNCTTGCGLYIREDLTGWSATDGTFTSENNGVSSSPYTATADWEAPATEGTYTISVDLADSGSFMCGGRQSVTQAIDIQVTTSINEPPVIDSLTAAPAQVFPGQSSSLTCTASDPEGDPVTYSWQTDHGVVTPGAGGAATFQAGAPGVAAIECTATDSGGAFAQDTVNVSVTAVVADKSINSVVKTPRRISADSMGNLYVVDQANGGISVVDMFTDELVYRLAIPGVTSVAVDWADNLLIGGRNGAGVVDRTGTPIAGLGGLVTSGRISDVAVDRARQLYGVLTRASGKVRIFNASGGLVTSFGSTGDGADQFKGPMGLAATPTGEWVVGDTGHGLLKVFSDTGTLVRSFGGLGGNAGEFVRMDDIEVDPDGVIYASDSFQDWILAFNPDGSLRETFGTYGDGLGEFKTAAGVAYVAAHDRLIATSVNSASLQVFRTSDDPVLPPNGAVPELSVTSLSFAEQIVLTESSPQSVTLSNTGASLLGILEVEVPDHFGQSNDCEAFVAPGQSCTFDVLFRPGAVGAHAGAMVISTSGDPSRVALHLAGTAIESTPDVDLAPTAIVFPPQEVGTVSEPFDVTLTNIGTAPLEIAAITASAEYLQSNSCPASLAVGAGCVIQVQFAPVQVSPQIPGTLTVTSNAPGSPHQVSLIGQGTALIPSISVDDPTADESDGEITFTVSLTPAATQPVTVTYATRPDTAIEGEDFEPVAGTLTFQTGEAQLPVIVTIVDDSNLEQPEEYFFFELTDPVNARFENPEDARGVGTITDDDLCLGPNLLANPSAEERPVADELPGWTLVAGNWKRTSTGASPVDGRYVFQADIAMDSELMQEVDVTAYADWIDASGGLWFNLIASVQTRNLDNTPSAALGVEFLASDGRVLETHDTGFMDTDSQWEQVAQAYRAPFGTAAIRIRLRHVADGFSYFDDLDLFSERVATLVVDDLEVPEGNEGLQVAPFDLSLSCAVSYSIRVDYATLDPGPPADGIATPGDDFVPDAGQVTLDPGETTATVPIEIIGDTIDEGHEGFALGISLMDPSDAVLLVDEGLGLILNDDFCQQQTSYWLNHTSVWPVDWLVLGGTEYEKPILLFLLGYSGSDESHNLAKELTATKLNLLAGSPVDGIDIVVEEADAFLITWPPGSKPNGAAKRQARAIIALLEDYNTKVCPSSWGRR